MFVSYSNELYILLLCLEHQALILFDMLNNMIFCCVLVGTFCCVLNCVISVKYLLCTGTYFAAFST